MNTLAIFPKAFPHGIMFLQEKDFHDERTRTPSTKIAGPHHSNADPDPSYHFDEDPDLTFRFNADQDAAPHLRPLIYRPPRASF